jgi:hypothetical protein
LAGSRDGPVVDEVKFGLCRTATIGSDITTNILDAVGEKFTFLELEGDMVF